MSPHTPTNYTVSHGSLSDTLLAERWEFLRANSPQRSPFSSAPFATGMREFAGYDNRVFIVSDAQQDIAGILTYTQRKGPFLIATVPPFTSFSSLLTTRPLQTVATSEAGTPYALLLHKLREQFDHVLLHHHPTLKDVRLFQWTSWKATPLYTFHIDLTDAAQLESNWSTSTKRTFKKHASTYSFQEDASALQSVINLAQASYGRHGRPLPLPAKQLTGLISQLQEAGMVRIFTITSDSSHTPTAGLALLHDQEVAYYWLAGSVPGHSMTVLLGHLFPLLASEGIRLFDFVGANTPYIAEFKRRFGPELVPYYATQSSPSKSFASLQSLKRALRSWR